MFLVLQKLYTYRLNVDEADQVEASKIREPYKSDRQGHRQKRLRHPKVGVPPSPKSSFAAFSGKGHEVFFESHASPLPGGFTTAAYLSGPAPAEPGDSTRAATRW